MNETKVDYMNGKLFPMILRFSIPAAHASIFSVSITCLIWIIVLIFPKQILAAFGGTEEMFQIGISGLRINFCITHVLGFVMLATTFFQAINRPAPSIIITGLRQIVFLVSFIYILPILFEINGIFFAQPISDLLATFLSVVLVLKEKKRMMCSATLR